MIYLISPLRRLKFKSAFYASIPISFLIAIFSADITLAALSIPCSITALLFTSTLINYFDRKQNTNIPCRLCGYEHSVLLYPKRFKKTQAKEKGSFACTSFDHGVHPDIYYCPECRNGFLINIATDAFDQTKKQGHQLYSEVIDTEYLKNISGRHYTYKNITANYNQYFKNKSILEIGTYYGAFYDQVVDVCASYTGVEPSKHACNYLRQKNPNIKLINDNIDGATDSGQLQPESFDTVVLFDVIEHVPDPIATLKKLRPLLKPNGHLLFSTINIEASISIAMGPFWPWFMDMHYYYFSDRGYYDMLHRSGFLLKAHHHFPYMVSFFYFLNKTLSIFLPWRLPATLEKFTSFYIPIKLGDTVLIIGKKPTNEK